MVVDAFARWRITDPVRFRQAAGVQGIQAAEMRLEPIVIDAIRGVLGTVPSTSVLSDDRTSLMNQIRDEGASNSGGLGIEIIDVRLTRTDLPEQNLNATYAGCGRACPRGRPPTSSRAATRLRSASRAPPTGPWSS